MNEDKENAPNLEIYKLLVQPKRKSACEKGRYASKFLQAVNARKEF